MHIPPKLSFIHPALADEMRNGLLADGGASLVPQVEDLRILRACRCG